MAVKLKISNPNLNNEESTYLGSDYSSGTTLTVRSNEGFEANKFAVAGEPGQEQTELRTISSVSGDTSVLISSAYRYSHPKSTPLYQSDWDKISVERGNSLTGSFSAISGSPFNIEWDDSDLGTLVDDTTGSTSNYYRWRYYNSATNTYSSYSGVLPGSGLSNNQAGFVIRKVRRNPITQGISDEVMYHYMDDLQNLVYETIPEAWWFTKEGTQVTLTANTYRYAISSNWSDFVSMKYLLYRYIAGNTDNTFPLSFVTQLEFYNYKADANQSSSDTVTMWTLLPPDTSSAKGYIGLHPTPSTASCKLQPVYYFELSSIEAFDDTLVVPNPKIYEDYILYRIYDDIKGDAENARKYNDRVATGINLLKGRAKRQLGQKELRRFRGSRGFSRLFGEQGASSSDDYRERYW